MNYKGRTILASVLIAAVFAGLGVRLAFLHLRPSASTLARIEKGRHMEEETRGPRGRILDRGGNILAVDIAARHLCADPKFILENGDIQQVCEAVTKVVPLSRSEVWKLLDQPERQYVRINKYMREKTLEPLMAMKLKGVIFEETSMRNYPKGALGAHVIGFSNREGVGSAGAEQRMNSYLQGTTGLRVSQKDGRRHEIYSRRTVDIEPQSGADVYLTIDQQVQHFAERALDELVEQYHPQGAWAIVQNVRTGEILAMASLPTYNPNCYGAAPAEWMRNRTMSYGYEPGSVMKAMIVASALDAGAVTPRDVFDCENGRWMYGGRALHDSHGEGLLSVADIIKKSSNIGAAKIALQMGNEKVYQSLRSFGFGSRTGMDLPGEEAGILWPVSNWSKISITRLAMGHEINVTALQMLSALSAIANDGIRMRPYMVQKVVDPGGETIFETLPSELNRPIRADTAKTMRRLLARVTQPGGTGTKAAVRGYPVAGKTGTAQKVRPKEEGGGYYDHKYVASFAGFLPVENPAISIIVVADDPQGAHYGGTVCGPAFQRIADQTVRYLRISPQGFPTEYVSEIEE
ncbi:MAG: penicillin-binding protein 2 [Kiritimatiellales bacterium]|nr:penicillin-binding protein 2 [Kiritimatiellota bacterium]MBL7011807.1 penicillin-binding protein 2 [Kiritimatiellales bacterium]